MSERDPLRDLHRYAAHLESSVHPARARARVDAALRAEAAPAIHRRAAVVAATAMVFAISNVALAAVADPSAPGDALYGVDRAYESITAPIGLAGDLPSERLDEAATATTRGDRASAVQLVSEALSDIEGADRLGPQLLAAPPGTAALHQLITLGRDIVSASGDDVRLGMAIQAMERALQDPVHPDGGRGTSDEPSSPAASPGPQTTAPGRSSDTPGATAPGPNDNPRATAPGQNDNPSATAPGQSGDSPSDTAPGQDDNPGTTAPGQSGDSPSDTAPGQNDNPGNTAPGQSDNPGNTAPGQSGDNPSATAPGQGGGRGRNGGGPNGP